MEEKEKKASAVKKTDRPEKMSYEQLENVAHQLSEQAKQLYIKLQAADMNNMFKRLDYLFKVVENGNVFNKPFFENCVSEIEGIMTIPKEDKEEEKSSDSKSE